MPFIPHTPESLLPRSDSKNPATTCKGLTSSGRPCRRALASSPSSSPAPSQGVLAVLTEEDNDGNRAAAFFCWQHRDQAQNLASTSGNDTEVVPLKERTSIDTLVDRLGVVDLDNDVTPTKSRKHKRKKESGSRPSRRDTLPEQWHDVPGPLISVPEEFLPSHPRENRRNGKPRPKSNVVPSMFCCLKPADDEDFPLPRRRTEHEGRTAIGSRPPNMTQTPPRSQLPYHYTHPPFANDGALNQRKPVSQTPPRPPPDPSPSSKSQTTTLLSLIPQHLSPQTTSALLTELAKPISPADEAGYIYIFWLTPTTNASTPSAELVSTLLSAPTDSSKSRRMSDLLRSNSTTTNGKNTVLLKIGRASNVHRRLTQWTRQCSHNLTLMRYYPYQPTLSPTASPATSPGPSPVPSPRGRQLLSPQTSDDGPRKAPHVHRVERLIHIELAEKRKKGAGKCDECGREHREWFEIEATTAGLRKVDGCVRRWVGWAERQEDSKDMAGERQLEGYY
jgi:hypothetical protein